jgi:hypothetical protein
MTYIEEPLKVALAVGNALIGVYNFIVISIPQSWRIINMPMSSDVFSSISQGNVKWVRDGEVEHFINAPLGRIALRIKIWPGIKSVDKIKDYRKQFSEGNVKVGGHDGIFYKFKRKYLLIGERNVLAILAYCPITQRTLQIEFIGGEEWVDEVLNTLNESQCHINEGSKN